jgi:hypothetical protein
MWKQTTDMIESVKECFYWLWCLWDLPEEKCKECGKVKDV